jgi:flagella basal body P-ring formation protein FlgA
MIRIFLAICCLSSPLLADVVMPVHTIRANSIIMESDLIIQDVSMSGTVSDPLQILGMEAKRNLYAGRPIRPGDFGPPALVERNQIVALKYQIGGLLIATEGRALARGGVGDYLRVLNLSSRNTITGRVDNTGAVVVGQ